MNQICRLLGISKKTYYYSIEPAQTLEQRYGRLKSMLERIIQKNPSYGYRRIKKALFEVYGEVVNHKVLLKLLLAWGLQFKRRIRKPRLGWMTRVLDFLQIRANLVWRLTKQKMITRCLQVIVSDVTELYYQGKKAYLCVHMDIYGKMIYGWHLLTAPNSELVVFSWKKAVATVKRWTGSSLAEIIAHQDRGSVYTGADYILAVLKEKCRLSYSRRGEPGDNAVNESFFSRLKEEWRDVFMEAQSFDELQNMVRKAIDYYNNERYHSTIALKTPLRFTKEQVGHLTAH